jgi:hypothetical protein
VGSPGLDASTGVGVARYQAQGLPFAFARDHDRRVWSRGALREVERAFEPVVLSFEGALVAAPHSQGYLRGLLQHLEAFLLRREGDAESPRLLVVAEPMPSQARPPESTSSVVTALTKRAG